MEHRGNGGRCHFCRGGAGSRWSIEETADDSRPGPHVGLRFVKSTFGLGGVDEPDDPHMSPHVVKSTLELGVADQPDDLQMSPHFVKSTLGLGDVDESDDPHTSPHFVKSTLGLGGVDEPDDLHTSLHFVKSTLGRWRTLQVMLELLTLVCTEEWPEEPAETAGDATFTDARWRTLQLVLELLALVCTEERMEETADTCVRWSSSAHAGGDHRRHLHVGAPRLICTLDSVCALEPMLELPTFLCIIELLILLCTLEPALELITFMSTLGLLGRAACLLAYPILFHRCGCLQPVVSFDRPPPGSWRALHRGPLAPQVEAQARFQTQTWHLGVVCGRYRWNPERVRLSSTATPTK